MQHTSYTNALTHPTATAALRRHSRRLQPWTATKHSTRWHNSHTVCSMGKQTVGSAPLVYVIMGVSGCGKSTVGAMLADKLHCPFYDADNYHPTANIRKMSAGIPLTDDDRWPWLQRLADLIRQHVQEGTPAVLACSALKPAYRQVLRAAALPDEHHPAANNVAVTAATGIAVGAAIDVAVSDAQSDTDTENGDEQPSDADDQVMPQLDQQQQQQQQSPIAFVLLNPSKEQLLQRVRMRAASGKHFMPPSLLEDQLQQLSYDPAEMFLCFGCNTSSSSSGSGGEGSGSCEDKLLGSSSGVSTLSSKEGIHGQAADLPTAQQNVDAVIKQVELLHGTVSATSSPSEK